MAASKDNGSVSCNSFAKTICSICFEDLKPVVEDLQSISVCGHVFHELCLQQWFEYCPKGKKRNCPVCKQTCTNASVWRLYFQSIGDSNDSNISQKLFDHEESPKELRIEVNRLEGKVVALASSLEQQQEEFKAVEDQLSVWKEKHRVESKLKAEALTQKANIQQLLRIKSEELDKSTLESIRMQERNMLLAKELASFKLASDLNLEEEEVMKLASLGNDAGSKETVDVLRKSLVLRNKSYKELMMKCNILGRGEARCLHKLEKANVKINKLKLRVQELETLTEMKDNEVLRALKHPDSKSNIGLHGKEATNHSGSECSDLRHVPNKSFCPKKAKLTKTQTNEGMVGDITSESVHHLNDKNKCDFSIDEYQDIMQSSIKPHEILSKKAMSIIDKEDVTQNHHVSSQDIAFGTQNEVDKQTPDEVFELLGSQILRKSDKKITLVSDMDCDVICIGAKNSTQRSLHSNKENILKPPISPGKNCFTGGFIAPDGTTRHLGKWCKKIQDQRAMEFSSGFRTSSARTGDLIATGADGRGGRIKVLRTIDQSSSENNVMPSWSKKCKFGSKANRLQPQGCLQIEHFFQKTG